MFEKKYNVCNVCLVQCNYLYIFRLLFNVIWPLPCTSKQGYTVTYLTYGLAPVSSIVLLLIICKIYFARYASSACLNR